jgi:predicted nuclease with TOPRIM domain
VEVGERPQVDTEALTSLKKDFQLKIFKQHKELIQVKEELEGLQQDKRDLEAEVKSRNDEIYQLNEKLMLLEIN